MRKKSKLAMTLAGMGILGLLTGCKEEEVKVVPLAPIENFVPESSDASGSAEEGSSPSAQDKLDLIKPIDESAIPSGESAPLQNGNSVAPAPNTGNSSSSAGNHSSGNSSTDKKETEMIALADTEEQAKEIAELYGIELKSYSLGVAVYTTTQDPQELIMLGMNKGYPLLSLNHTYTYFN